MTTSAESIRLAEALRAKHAGYQLTPVVARLYSHHTRVRAGQPGLTSWAAAESNARLDEAVALIDAGLTLRAAKNDGCRDCLRRGAELLEWLPPSNDADTDAAYILLSAAAYQLAGYPARAFSILKNPFPSDQHSNILRSFLRGRFHETMLLAVDYWSRFPRPPDGEAVSAFEAVDRLVIDQTIGAFGITAAFARWGDRDRLDAAIEKLDSVRGMLARGKDQKSWLLAKLTAAFAEEFVSTSLRTLIDGWQSQFSEVGRSALERYVRVAYSAGRCQAWPSQRAGIDRLRREGSFALCTPTGSGKTSVAELAILQSVFGAAAASLPPDSAEPIAIYLVPSRALAAEVEGKMTRVFRRLSQRKVVVTGLYGGTDWGPADAWLTSPDPAVLICTYEKGEALMRFLGPQFMSRVSLVILDEAHSVRYDGNLADLATANSRAFRLEALGMRLLDLLEENRARVIALSAVATGIERPLHAWVTNASGSAPVAVDYRSTRQLIGKLLVSNTGQYEIQYDLLDRSALQFQGSTDSPYVQNPIPPCPAAPGWDGGGVDVSLRPPLLWAAMHLARDGRGTSRGVLISLTQNLGAFAKDCLKLLSQTWATATVPEFFRAPETAEYIDLYQRGLLACADVFGDDSVEYQLLSRGIVLHHGGMPPSLGRLLVALVTEGIVNLVIATSTLSEGVNLPLETVLIQSLLRNGNRMSAGEFANLAGRAGRPRVSAEGQTLVLLRSPERENRSTWGRYKTLIAELDSRTAESRAESHRESPLGELLDFVWGKWRELAGSDDRDAFHHWLESTAVDEQAEGAPPSPLFSALDTLDSLLLAAVVEFEQAQSLLSVEDSLKKLWQHSFAAQVSSRTELRDLFVHRGKAIGVTVYADKRQRRSLYRTGLPPRSGAELLDIYPAIRTAAASGVDYARWDADRRLDYVTAIVGLVGHIKRFEYAPKASKQKVAWQHVLAWWLDPVNRPYDPGPNRRANWFKYVSHHFYYLFSWGIGSFIGVATADAQDEGQSVWQLDDWLRTGLPWAVFWLKELVAWGTLDPAAAYLLAKGLAPTRTRAQALARPYYQSTWAAGASDPIDPRAIRRWAEAEVQPLAGQIPLFMSGHIPVTLDEDFAEEESRWRVLPVRTEEGTSWIDPAGYRLATSLTETNLGDDPVSNLDFFLDSEKPIVEAANYL
jgi:hypothetical protein